MRCAHFELFNFELRIRNLKFKIQNSKFKIQKFKIAGEAENNSKFKTQNSKLPKATIQNSKFKTQNVILSFPLPRAIRHKRLTHVGLHIIPFVVSTHPLAHYLGMVRREIYQVSKKQTNNRDTARRKY